MTDAPKEQQVGTEQRLRTQIRKLVLMKETGPKSAAWHRARVGTIWRLQRQLDESAGGSRQMAVGRWHRNGATANVHHSEVADEESLDKMQSK